MDSATAPEKREHTYPLSRVSMTMKATLSAPRAHKLYLVNFTAVSRHLYNIGIMTRIVGCDEAARKADEEVSKIFRECHEELEIEMRRMDKMIKDNSISGSSSYSKNTEYEVEVIHPNASRFLALIREYDKLCSRIDTVWLAGIIDDDQKCEAEYRYEKRVRKVANLIRELGHTMRSYTQKHAHEVKVMKGESIPAPELMKEPQRSPAKKGNGKRHTSKRPKTRGTAPQKSAASA